MNIAFLKMRDHINYNIFKSLDSISLGVISGFSVFYFLYFFDAYGIQKGISYSGHSHLFRSTSFGILTFVYLTIFETWLKPKLDIISFKHQIIWYISLIIIGCQFIFILFNFFWNWQEWNMEAYLLIIKEYPLMLILPFSFFLILKTDVQPVQHEDNFLSFQSENGKDHLKIQLQDFLYATPSENYITIFYSSSDKTEQHLIRKPLKVLEHELEAYPEIMRSHRSYLVNKLNIQNIRQNKGKVYLEVNETSIPVSKQFQINFLG